MKRLGRETAKDSLCVLAEFRYQLRLFLRFSETAAQKVGLQPQQHQLLLQLAGTKAAEHATVGYLAERLKLRHNTVVELSRRCEDAGLIVRKQGDSDRRRVALTISSKGRRVLEKLSLVHARELNDLAPQLIQTLTSIKAVGKNCKHGFNLGAR